MGKTKFNQQIEIVSENSQLEKQETLFIKILLPVIAFFASWGGGTQFFTQYDLSKIFVILSCFLLLHWLAFSKPRILAPKWVTVFIIFAVFHALVAYAFYFTEELSLVPTGVVQYENGFTRVDESSFLHVVRMAYFCMFGFAFAREIVNKKQILAVSILFGLGLLAMSIMPGYQTTRDNEMRYSGGFLNANAYGLSGLTAAFLGFLSHKISEIKLLKILSILCIGVGIAALIASSCRGGIVGTLLGAGVLVWFSKAGDKLRIIIIGALIILSVFMIMPDDYLVTTQTRFDVGRMLRDGGSGRTAIWGDYLGHFPDYALAGVGAGRSEVVIQEDWSYKLAATHNIYLQVLVEYGLLGFVLFVGALSSLINCILKTEVKFKPFLLALVFAWMGSSFFLNSFTERTTWIIFGVVVALLRLSANKQANSLKCN